MKFASRRVKLQRGVSQTHSPRENCSEPSDLFEHILTAQLILFITFQWYAEGCLRRMTWVSSGVASCCSSKAILFWSQLVFLQCLSIFLLHRARKERRFWFEFLGNSFFQKWVELSSGPLHGTAESTTTKGANELGPCKQLRRRRVSCQFSIRDSAGRESDMMLPCRWYYHRF